jgi:hypothetical protein
VGSLFLLAPAIVELGLWTRWQAEVGEATARDYLFLLALKALGRERAPLYLGDPVLAAFAGLDRSPVADARLPPDPESPPRDWVLNLPEIAARWYPAHDRKLTIGAVAGIRVLRDAKAAWWLAASPCNDPDGSGLDAAWSVAIDPDLIRSDQTEAELAMLLSEAEHLQLGSRLGYPWLTPSLDAALSTAASLVLRRVAARLPGLGRTSPSYLARQFLAQPAELKRTAEALTVRLSGGPLAVVLRMAALPEALEVPWLSQPLRLVVAGGLREPA